jgi:hypothetical protein
MSEIYIDKRTKILSKHYFINILSKVCLLEMNLPSLIVGLLYFNNKKREDIWRALWRRCTSPLSYKHFIYI